MKNLITNLFQSSVSGPLFLMLTGSLLYLLRSIPKTVLDGVLWCFTVKLTISGQDEVFDWVSDWLGEHVYSKKSRVLKLSTGKGAQSSWVLSPGFGIHFFWDKEHGLVVFRRVSVDIKAPSLFPRPPETLLFYTLGRDQGRIRSLIDRAAASQEQSTLGVRVWMGGWWKKVSSKYSRSLDSVFLPETQKQEIVNKIDWFLKHEDWFKDKGLPYRLGCMWHGPPGTGKTSITVALAAHFKRPIYLLNPATVKDDNELLLAFTSAGSNAFILIEDVDAMKASKPREESAVPDPLKPADPTVAAGVSLSGLLNAIDGVAAPEGRVLVLTTNYRDRLDAALVRDARIDLEVKIDLMEEEQVLEMAAKFFPDNAEAMAAIRDLASGPRRPAATWQGCMMDLIRRNPLIPESTSGTV